MPVTVYLGPGGPAVTGKDGAKSLSLFLSLSLSLSPFFTVCLGLQVLRVSVAIFCCVPILSAIHTIVPLTFGAVGVVVV